MLVEEEETRQQNVNNKNKGKKMQMIEKLTIVTLNIKRRGRKRYIKGKKGDMKIQNQHENGRRYEEKRHAKKKKSYEMNTQR